MPDIQKSLYGGLIGLTSDHDLLVRTSSGAKHYVPHSADIARIVKLTQAAYDALSPADANTLYVIVG